MGPRSDERGNQYTVAADAAEGMSLQWGRAQMSAEIPFCSSKSATAMALQWGRAQMRAEINLRLPVETVAWLPFNGAALRLARKQQHPAGLEWSGSHLQWGRAQMSA